MNPSREEVDAALRLVQHDSTKIVSIARPPREYMEVIEGVYLDAIAKLECRLEMQRGGSTLLRQELRQLEGETTYWRHQAYRWQTVSLGALLACAVLAVGLIEVMLQ